MRLAQRILPVVLILCLLAGAAAAQEQVLPENPILFPGDSVEYVTYPDAIVNVLLIGIDFGTEGHWGSGYKTEITDCHTDAVMVIAINLTKNRVDLISLPRDSVTIVPGVRGVYKLNGAVNCGDTLEAGLDRTVAAAEWLLGGIRIDCYCAVDMSMMATLGDALGGVDFYMDMKYVGSSGRTYVEGWQHLDGTGIMDYVRARTNATVDGNDLGRTRRQRDMMTAIFEKLAQNPQSAVKVLSALTDPDAGFFTNITGRQAIGFLALAPILLQMDDDSFASYSLDGQYRTAMGYNFTFTDQENRASVIQTVYGIAVDELPYVSFAHAKWLMDTGFYSIHTIRVATELMETVEDMGLTFTQEQQALWDQFIDAYWNAVDQFQISADTLDGYAIGRMKTSRMELRNYGKQLAEAVGYDEDIQWNNVADYWYDDPYINQYQLDWR
ncbi:MAG TPA: LCP family protein [Candidatus Limiplasma sp.]|nr:LCP family protein [Candidatus Limiplasma sp.]